jgi:GNAT superfamily N-acetyltransferase
MTDRPAKTSVVVRPATPGDVALILALIRELAEFERALDEVHATEESLRATLFADRPAAFCHVAEYDGQAAGFALWFLNYSTWLGGHGLYLEDLYVREPFRGKGVGIALLAELAGICVERGYPRLEWWVLDWNPARDFYQSIGATAMTEWIPYRLTGDALRRLSDARQNEADGLSVG